MAMETEQPYKFRILMFPWLAHGHIFPFLELSKKLSTTNYFDIYICSTAVNLDSITSHLQKDSSDHDHDASIKLVQLHLPSSPELPPHLHTTKNLPPHLFPILLQAFQDSSPSFSEILNTLKPDLLIYDFFQPWAAKLALSQGIPSVYFATSGAASVSHFYHRCMYGTGSTFPYKEICMADHEKDAPVDQPKLKDAFDDAALQNLTLSCDIVLIKSSRLVEGKYIDYLSELSQKKVVPAGVLVQGSSDCTDDENSEILQWLSKKDCCSTVFICFGSEHFLSTEQTLEIAKGLELCETSFVWIIRLPVEEKALCIEDALPEGFLDRVEKRGLVVQGWAPQAKILSHPSIGGFVSHCGWSSITESMYFGVPVIGMPIKFDQPINARLVVEAGIGVEVERDENGCCFAGEDVAKAINEVIVEKTGENMRCRARSLSEKMKKGEEGAAHETAEQILWLCKQNLSSSST